MTNTCLVVVLLFFLFHASAADFTRTVTASFKNGIPGNMRNNNNFSDCKICGDPGSYACSNGVFGDWNDGTLFFQDPLNATEAKLYVASAMSATVYGAFGCDVTQGATVDVRVEVAGNVLSIVKANSDLSNQCACGTCSNLNFVTNFAGGFPYYKTGDTNRIKLSAKNNFICVNRVQLTITYTPVPPRNWLYTSFDKFYTKGGEACAFCGNYGQFTCNDDPTNWVNGRTLKVSFMDPLPRGAVLYMANVTMYGAYACTSRSSSYDYIIAALQDTTIQQTQVYYSGNWNCTCTPTSQAVGCNGPAQFNTARGFPTGWPQYVYGGTNNISITIPSANSRYCISRIDVQFTVYYRGKYGRDRNKVDMLVFLFRFVVVLLVLLVLYLNKDPSPFDHPSHKNPNSQNVFTSFDGLLVYKPKFVHYPSSEAEIVQIVEQSNKNKEKVKIVGTGHSWSKFMYVDTKNIWHMVQLSNYSQILDVDTTTKQVTVQAGIRLYQLNEELDKMGLALPNLPSIASPSIGGVISTATHGTGAKLPSISDQVIGMRLILSNGTVIEVSASKNAHLFDAARVGLGMIGIISTVTLQCVPNFNLHYIEESGRLDTIWQQVPASLQNNDYFLFYWLPYTNYVRILRSNVTQQAITESNSIDKHIDRVVAMNLFASVLQLMSWFPSTCSWMMRTIMQPLMSIKDKQIIAPSYHVLHTPLVDHINDAEFFVPLEKAQEAHQTWQQVVHQHRVNFISAVRFIKCDTALLSPMYCTYPNQIFVSFTVSMYRRNVQEYHRLVHDAHKAFQAFGGTFHWAKTTTFVTRSLLHNMFDARWEQFKQARNEVDPNKMLVNEFVDKLLE